MRYFTNTSVRRSLLLVVLVALLGFVPGAQSIPPIDRDEARFAQASKQMLHTGDLVVVYFQKEWRAKKPIGIYWMQAASAKIFGEDSIGSYRVPSLIGALLVVVVGFFFARQLLAPNEATLAGLMLASATVLVAEAHLAKTDAMLLATIIIQQWLIWSIYKRSQNGEPASPRLAYGFWVILGIATLIKGPIAPLVAIGTIVSLSLIKRNWRWLYQLRPLGIVVYLGIILPWIILVSAATDGNFLKIAFLEDFLSKAQSGQEEHGAPPLTHLAILIMTFWPGSLLLARGIITATKRFKQSRSDIILFLSAWIIPFWIIIELTPTKLPHYFLPTMPAIAMLAALGVNTALPPLLAKNDPASPRSLLQRFDFLRSLTLLWEGLFVMASLGFGIIVLWLATEYGGSRFWASIALMFSVGVAALAIIWMRYNRFALLIAMIITAAIFHAITFGKVLPSLDDIHLAPRIKAAIEQLDNPPELIAISGYHEPSVVFMLGTDTLLFTPEDTALFLAESAGEGLAIVESRAQVRFLATASQANIRAKVVASVRGYNISKGQRVTLEFYRIAD